jgi:hypothetical protein
LDTPAVIDRSPYVSDYWLRASNAGNATEIRTGKYTSCTTEVNTPNDNAQIVDGFAQNTSTMRQRVGSCPGPTRWRVVLV